MKTSLTNYGSFILMREALKSAVSLLKKCDENASTEQHKHFVEMMKECIEMNSQLHEGAYRDTETSGDGLQVAFTVYESLCSTLDEIPEFEGAVNLCEFIRTKRNVKTLDKRVKIQSFDSVAVKEVEISPLQEAYRKARTFVQSHVAPDTRRQECVYFDEMTEKEVEGVLYKARIYCEIPLAMNENPTQETIEQTKQLLDIIHELNLTPTQEDVLTLRLKGYGLQAIGTYRGKSKQAVAKTLKQIAEKALLTLDTNKNIALYYALSEKPEGEAKVKYVPKKHRYYAAIPKGLDKYREMMKKLNKK